MLPLCPKHVGTLLITDLVAVFRTGMEPSEWWQHFLFHSGQPLGGESTPRSWLSGHTDTLLIRPQNTHLGVQRKSKWPRLSPRQPREGRPAPWHGRDRMPTLFIPCPQILTTSTVSNPVWRASAFTAPQLPDATKASSCALSLIHSTLTSNKRPPPLGEDPHVSSQNHVLEERVQVMGFSRPQVENTHRGKKAFFSQNTEWGISMTSFFF